MKDKILFWIDNDLIQFGIAKFLQEKYDCDMYAIIDINSVTKKFFLQQNIVKFKKSWYYRDCFDNKIKSPDLDYLKKFEVKYKINLWERIYLEPYFYKYNPYHKFKYDEILSIIEKEFKFFEKVLEDVKPDFLIIKVVDYQQNYFFQEICKVKGINILMLVPTRLGFKATIATDYDELVNLNSSDHQSENNEQIKSKLESFFKKYDRTKQEDVVRKKQWNSVTKWLKAAIKFFLFSVNDTYRNYYANYGRTRLKVLFNEGPYFLKRWHRERFLNTNCYKRITDDKKVVYYPLHYEPERAAIRFPYYMNQLETITNIAKSLPIDFVLYVKEHGTMKLMGWRKISFYKHILELPNVRLLHHSIPSKKILEKCDLVITIAGTTGFDAAYYRKPTIVLSDVSYLSLPSVSRLKSFENLRELIQNSLKKKISLLPLSQYIDKVDEGSFDFFVWGFNLEIFDYFFEGGFLREKEISIEDFNCFLEKHKDKFEKLTNEYLKKIK